MSIPYHIKDKISWYLWKSMINEINDEYKRKIYYEENNYFKGIIYGRQIAINWRKLEADVNFNNYFQNTYFVITNFATGLLQKVKKITYTFYATDPYVRTPSNYVYSSGRLSKSGYLYTANFIYD